MRAKAPFLSKSSKSLAWYRVIFENFIIMGDFNINVSTTSAETDRILLSFLFDQFDYTDNLFY